MNDKNKIQYPFSKKVDQADDFFGVTVKDPYRWLEEPDTTDTVQWIEAQNTFTQSLLQEIPFRNQIKNRLTELYYHNKISLPYKYGDNYYMYKQEGLENQKSFYIKRSGTKEYEKLIDASKLSDDATVSLVFAIPSDDDKYVAYATSKSGSDWWEFFVINLETGEQLSDHIKKIKFSPLVWYKDGFFYSRYFINAERVTKNRYSNVYYHKIGTDVADDILIYEADNDEVIGCGLEVSNDKKYLFLYSWTSPNNFFLSYKKISVKRGPFTLLTTEKGYYYVRDIDDEGIIIYTDYNAPNFRLTKILFNNKSPDNWQDIIPEKDYKLQHLDSIKGGYIASYLVDLIADLKVYDKKGNFTNNIQLPGNGTVKQISATHTSNEVFFEFESYLQPLSIYKYNALENKLALHQSINVKFNQNLYESKRIFYTSKDGTKVPMFINYKKGTKLDGTNPTILHGYGGFKISYLPKFDIAKSFFLEQGGIVAVASIRGGSEYGSEWHQAGKLVNKQNVFDDFIAAANYLIDEQYTSKEKLAISGRSNGGLLIGAVINQQPDLFKVAIPMVGLMDMLRYHKFTIGHAWASEFGLSENQEQFNYLIKYSPLHNIKKNTYPAVIATTAIHDDRVVPSHSYKYIATLQQHQKSNLPVIIKIQTKAGHGLGKSTQQSIDEWTDIWSFTMHHLNMKYVEVAS